MPMPLILVVEDNPTLQKLVAMMAKRRNVETVVVGSCSEAIHEIERDPNRFLMVLMDLSLPDNSGLECTSTIRGLMERNIPIIAMTGHAMPGDKEACLDAGMDDYLCKPFTIEQFSDMITKWMQVEPFPILPTPAESPGAQESA